MITILKIHVLHKDHLLETYEILILGVPVLLQPFNNLLRQIKAVEVFLRMSL